MFYILCCMIFGSLIGYNIQLNESMPRHEELIHRSNNLFVMSVLSLVVSSFINLLFGGTL